MSTTRRAFFSHLASAAVAGAVVPLVLPILGAGKPDVVFGESVHGAVAELQPLAIYHAYGHIRGGDPICDHIAAVMLDGEALSRMVVIEADDRAGWVLVVNRVGSYLDDGRPAMGTRRLTGEVRYVWSEEALT